MITYEGMKEAVQAEEARQKAAGWFILYHGRRGHSPIGSFLLGGLLGATLGSLLAWILLGNL